MDLSKVNELVENYKKEIKKYTIMIIFSVIFLVTFLILLKVHFMFFIGFVISIIFLIYSIILDTQNASGYASIRNKIFNKYMLPALNGSFACFRYDKYKGLDHKMIRRLKLLDTGNSIYSDELIEGYYRGISFIQSSVLCEHESTDSDGDNHSCTTFSGRIIILGASLFYDEGHVHIIHHKNRNYRRLKNMRKVTLNEEVEDYYNIYVDREDISIPKGFLAHITEIARAFPKYICSFSILNDRIYMVVEGIHRDLYNLKRLNKIDQESLESLIKQDSFLITNTISSILGKEE